MKLFTEPKFIIHLLFKNEKYDRNLCYLKYLISLDALFLVISCEFLASDLLNLNNKYPKNFFIENSQN